MRLQDTDGAETLNKYKGMRARLIKHNQYSLSNNGIECDEIVTILGACPQKGCNDIHGAHVYIQRPKGSPDCYWWVDVELDPDGNY